MSFFISAVYAYPQIELSESEKQFISQNPEIVLGTEKSWEPYVILNEDGSVSGYDADILQRVNAITGANFVLQAGNWRDMQDKAKRREIDGLSTGGIHEERKRFLNFSDVYISLTKFVLIAKGKDQSIRNDADLVGKKIAIHRGNLVDEKLAQKYPDSEILPFDSVEEMIRAVVLGDADVTFGNGATLYQASKLGLPYLEIAYQLDQKLDLAFGVRRDWPEAVSILNKGLAQISKLERIKLIDKWFLGTNFSARHSIAEFTPIDWLSFSIVWKTIVIIIIVVTVIVIWNRKLSKMNTTISNQLNLINDNLPIVHLQANKRIASVNKAFHDWLSMSDASINTVVEKDFDEVFKSDENIAIDTYIYPETDIRTFHHLNEVKYVAVKQLPVQDRKENKGSYVINDITNRIKSLNIEFEKKATQQRLNILGDMHDGFGGVITVLSMAASNALNTESIEDKDSYLKQIATLSKEAATEMRLMMNALSHRDINWEILVSDLRQVANALLENNLIEMTFCRPDRLPDRALLEDQYFSIYRWFKECIVNVVKHANATKLAIEISCKGNVFVIQIKDNGIGLATDTKTHRHGFNSMKKRADELGAKLEIYSDSGTAVILSIGLDG